MHSGKLRHRIAIERRSDELDDVGQPVETWAEFLRASASIEDRRGREFLEGGQATLNEVTTNIIIRYRDGIQPEMRAVDICTNHGGQEYNIVNVRDLTGRRRELLIECSKIRVTAEVA